MIAVVDEPDNEDWWRWNKSEGSELVFYWWWWHRKTHSSGNHVWRVDGWLRHWLGRVGWCEVHVGVNSSVFDRIFPHFYQLKDTQIKTQLPPLCWTPWWQRLHQKTDPLVQPSPDNTTQALLQPQGITTSRFEWGRHHLVKPKSPPDRDWTMQSLNTEMGIQQGRTACECWNEQTMKHLLVCPIHEDLEEFNPRARSCAQHWVGVCSDSRSDVLQ